MDDVRLPRDTIFESRDQCLCLATQRAARLLARRFDRLFAPLELTNGQFSLLMALSSDWHPRLGELAEFLGMDSTTISAAIKPLTRRGLVTLETDDSDRRVRRPAITGEGYSLLKQAVPMWEAEHGRLHDELAAAGLFPAVLLQGMRLMAGQRD